MLSEGRLTVRGRLLAGSLLIGAIILLVRVCFFSNVDYLVASLGFSLLLCLICLCIRLIPTVYRSSRAAYVIAGIAIGAGIIGLIGSGCGLAVLGVLTGGLVGWLIADALAAGLVDTVLAGAILFAGISALMIGLSPFSGAFGGTMAIPGGSLGAAVIWLCRPTRGKRIVGLVLAGAALLGGLLALAGPKYAFWAGVAITCCFLGASICVLRLKPRRPLSADDPACSSQSASAVALGTDERDRTTRAAMAPAGDLARRRRPGTVRRLMIAVVWCAFVLSGFRSHVASALDGMTRLLFLVGAPAAGVILERRLGGSGIWGGAIAGAAAYSATTAATYAWLYLNPPTGPLPEPLKQIAQSAASGATLGALIGVLVWGLMLMEQSSETGGATFPRGLGAAWVQTGDRARGQRHFQLGVLVAAMFYLVEGDLVGTVSDRGYAFIFAAWVLLLVAVGSDLVRIPSRSLESVLSHLRSRRS